MRSKVSVLALVVLLLGAGACTDRCLRNSDCPTGQSCQLGACASGADSGAALDLATPDLATPDLAVPDLATPDLAMLDLAPGSG